MNILNLIRGQKIKITDLTKDKFLQVGIFCKMPVGIKLDIACFASTLRTSFPMIAILSFLVKKYRPVNQLKSWNQKTEIMNF